MGTIFVDNIKQQSSQGSGTITIGASGETVALASGVKQSNLNDPSFYAYKNSAQTISNNTNTKVVFDLELFDNGSCYDTSNSRFTPGVAGKYLCTGVVSMTNHPTGKYVGLYPYKNGSQIYSELGVNGTSGDFDTRCIGTFVVDLDADDYLEIFTRHNGDSTENTRTGHEVRFMAQRIGT